MIGFIVIGLVAWLIARLVVPGRQRLSLAMTVGLGLIGSVVGAVVANASVRTTSSSSMCSVRSWPSRLRSC